MVAVTTSLSEVGFMRPLVAANDGTVIAGNLTAEALGDLGMEDVIVVRSDGTKPIVHIREDVEPGSDVAIKAGLYDNRSAELADGYDPEILQAIMDEVGIAPVLMTEAEAAALIAFGGSGVDGALLPDAEPYSREVESPVYQITGERPTVADLVDETRTSDLIAAIDASSVPDDVKRFLRYGAYRHLRFDYAKVAEFYAHADADVQALMEESALVIIDVDRAIELGYARLTEDLRVIASEASDAE